MKNLKYISMIVFGAMTLLACDPLEDEVAAIKENRVDVADLVYTLTDDDYELAGEGFGNFSDIADVKSQVPLVLANNFPALGKNSSALVSYQYYNGSSPDLKGNYLEVTVPAQDYLDLGYTFGNFNNIDSDVAKWANWKYPDARDGDYMDVTFDYYSGGFHGGEISRMVYTVAYGWQYAWILPDAAYGDFFFESGIDFSNQGEGAEKIPAYLNYMLTQADDFYSLSVEVGTKIVVQYNYDDRCFGDSCTDPGEPNVPAVALYIFNGTEWKAYSDGYQTTTESLNFGHDGTSWVPDNTIKYTINNSDFALIVANNVGNADAIANLNQFGNFGTQWSHEEIVAAINFVLKSNFPANEVGQKYLVTYNTYPAGDLQVALILDASGDYIEQ